MICRCHILLFAIPGACQIQPRVRTGDIELVGGCDVWFVFTFFKDCMRSMCLYLLDIPRQPTCMKLGTERFISLYNPTYASRVHCTCSLPNLLSPSLSVLLCHLCLFSCVAFPSGSYKETM